MPTNVNTMQIGPWSVVVEREQIPVTSNSPTTDKEWRYIDAAGHGHFWKDGYPTLRWVSLPCSMDHDECDSEGYWVCIHCGEQIVPGIKPPSMFPSYINGPTYMTVIFDNGRERREYYVTDPAEVAAIQNDPVTGIAAVTNARERPDKFEFSSGP